VLLWREQPEQTLLERPGVFRGVSQDRTFQCDVPHFQRTGYEKRAVLVRRAEGIHRLTDVPCAIHPLEEVRTLLAEGQGFAGGIGIGQEHGWITTFRGLEFWAGCGRIKRRQRGQIGMLKDERMRYLKPIEAAHSQYISKLDEVSALVFEKRFHNLYIKLREFSRGESSSTNNLKKTPKITHLIFGLSEDIHRMKLASYPFDIERELLCKFIQERIDGNISTYYGGRLKHYGETLLNCYLDLVVTLTTLKTEKEIAAYPNFLVNPLTSQNMELDVLFEGFNIAFEFQGEHHYRNTVEGQRTQYMDAKKLEQCRENGVLLIPVNSSQLPSSKLFDLIANTAKDFLELGTVSIQISRREQTETSLNCTKRELANYFKLLQRLVMANYLFAPMIEHLDSRSEKFIRTQKDRYPITCTSEAPRLFYSGTDLPLIRLYRTIPRLAKIVRASNPSDPTTPPTPTSGSGS
jgi:hypothetical protein